MKRTLLSFSIKQILKMELVGFVSWEKAMT